MREAEWKLNFSAKLLPIWQTSGQTMLKCIVSKIFKIYHVAQ